MGLGTVQSCLALKQHRDPQRAEPPEHGKDCYTLSNMATHPAFDAETVNVDMATNPTKQIQELKRNI